LGDCEVGNEGWKPEVRSMCMRISGAQRYGSMVSFVMRYWLRARFLLETGDSGGSNGHNQGDTEEEYDNIPDWAQNREAKVVSDEKEPQPEPSPPPEPMTNHQKDRIEQYLNSGVCDEKATEWIESFLSDENSALATRGRAGSGIQRLEEKFGMLAGLGQIAVLKKIAGLGKPKELSDKAQAALENLATTRDEATKIIKKADKLA